MMQSETRMSNGEGVSPTETSDPTPLFLDPGDPAARPRLCVPVLENAVRAIGDRTMAPTEIGLQSVLATAAIALQGHADVETLGGSAPLSLFLLTVARSGERKSAADRPAVRAIRDHEEAALKAYATDLEAYERRADRLTNETELFEANDKIDTEYLSVPPICPRVLVGDVTFEGLLSHFGEGRPAIGLCNDDAGQLLGGHAMRRENRLKTAAGLSRLWDGAPIDRHRAGSGSATYFGRRVSAHLMIQPAIAEDLLADQELIDQGLLSRVLVAWPTSRIGFRTVDDPKGFAEICAQAASDLAIFDEHVAEWLHRPLPSASHSKLELKPRLLRLTSAAQKSVQAFYNAVETGQRPDGPFAHIDGVASKIAEQACRISGLLTLAASLDEEEVSGPVMENAIELADWYLNETRRLRSCGYASPSVRKAERLRRWLVMDFQGRCVSAREIQRSAPSPRPTAEEVQTLMSLLERHGWVERLPKRSLVGKTRPHAAWKVTPGKIELS